jgi:hypothetical protein
VWLLSGDSGYVTGAEIAVDGGLGVAKFAGADDVERAWNWRGPKP